MLSDAGSAPATTLRDRRNEVLRTILGTGIGTPAALALAGWPTGLAAGLVGVAGAVLGIAIAFGVEALLDRFANTRALTARVRELEATVTNRDQQIKLLQHQVIVARRETAISENSLEVWGGAYNEAQQTGQFLPFDALMARLEVTQKAKGIDQPIPPPEL